MELQPSTDLNTGDLQTSISQLPGFNHPPEFEIQEPVLIAVIDSGFDLSHENLNYADVSQHFNAQQFFQRRHRGLYVKKFQYDAGLSRRPHGTAVAGVAASIPAVVKHRSGHQVRIAGIAPGFPILPLKVAVKPTSKQVAASIDWAVQQGARVVNMSFKLLRQQVVIEAIVRAWEAGIVLCAAAGNYSTRHPFRGIDFPASHPNVIAVGATDGTGKRKQINFTNPNDWASQFGPELDVVAPGIGVKTLDERGPLGNLPGDYSLKGSGTSLACPQVAGLAALLFGIRPELTNRDVRALIEGNCDQLSGYTFSRVRGREWEWNREVGYGEVNQIQVLREIGVR